MRRVALFAGLVGTAIGSIYLARVGPYLDPLSAGVASRNASSDFAAAENQTPYRSIAALKDTPYGGLTTKFYVYKQSDSYSKCLGRYPDSIESYRRFKHGSEIWWLEQLETSPFRTRDPQDAELFVVPLLHSFEKRLTHCTWEFNRLWRAIQDGDIYHRHQGRDHLLLSTDFKAPPGKFCNTCMSLSLLDRRKQQYHVATPMVGHIQRKIANSTKVLTHAETQQLRQQDADAFMATRPNNFYFAGQADERHGYRSRLQFQRIASRLANSTFATTTNATVLDFVEQAMSTKFGLHIRGDNPQSSRLYEWIDLGAVLVLLSDPIYDGWLPGNLIPWRDFTIPLREDQSDEALLAAFNNNVLSMSPQKVEQMRAGTNKYAPLLLWGAPNSVVAEVLLLDAASKWKKILKEELSNGLS